MSEFITWLEMQGFAGDVLWLERRLGANQSAGVPWAFLWDEKADWRMANLHQGRPTVWMHSRLLIAVPRQQRLLEPEPEGDI
jgi:hypothetical protein